MEPTNPTELKKNHGKRWLNKDLNLLIDLAKKRTPISTISTLLERSERSIEFKLLELVSNVGPPNTLIIENEKPLFENFISLEKNLINTIKIIKKNKHLDLTKVKNKIQPMVAAFKLLEETCIPKNYDEDTTNVDTSLIETSITDQIYQDLCFCILNERTRNILGYRFGLNNSEPPQTFQKISENFNVTRERIRQIEKKGKNKFLSHIKRESTLSHNTLKLLLTQLFMNKNNDPNIEILTYLNETYGKTINVIEIAVIISFYIGFHSDYQTAKTSFINSNENIINAIKSKSINIIKNNKFMTNWELIFNDTIFPSSINFSPEEMKEYNSRKRIPNDFNESQTGSFFSLKCKRNILYESGEEYRSFQILEKLDIVKWYLEQPIKIPYTHQNIEKNYFPDILVQLQDGRCIIVEIKPLFHMTLELTLVKSLAALDYVKQNGMGYLLLDSRGNTIKSVSKEPISSKTNELLEAINSNSTINFQHFKKLIDTTNISSKEMASIIINNDLKYQQMPFRLSKLPKELSFESLIK